MSHSARRLPVASPVERILWPAKSASATDSAPAGVAEAWHPKNLAVREPLLPSSFAERLASVEREAHARGVSEGREDAAADAMAHVEGLLRRLAATIDEVGALRPHVLRRSESELVRLAIAIAGHIVRRLVEVDPTLLVTMAQAAIDRLGGAENATISLNPQDHAIVSRARGEVSRGAIDIVADPQIPRGGCVIRSAAGIIDAGVETQLRELSRGLVGESPDSSGRSSTPDANSQNDGSTAD